MELRMLAIGVSQLLCLLGVCPDADPIDHLTVRISGLVCRLRLVVLDTL